MAQTTLVELLRLANQSKRFAVEKNDHDGSYTIARRHPKTNKILQGFRCFITGQCLDLSTQSSFPFSPHEAASSLDLVPKLP